MKHYDIGQELGLVKTYTGKDMPEAMMKLRHDLGVDAMILDQQERYTPGWLGFLPFGKKKYVEITACPNLKAQKPKEKPQPEEPSFSTIRRGVQTYGHFSRAGTLAAEPPAPQKTDTPQSIPSFQQSSPASQSQASAKRFTLEEIRGSLAGGRGGDHGRNRADRTGLLDIEGGPSGNDRSSAAPRASHSEQLSPGLAAVEVPAQGSCPPTNASGGDGSESELLNPVREAVKGMIRESAGDCRHGVNEIMGLKRDIEEMKRLFIEFAGKGSESRRTDERFRDIRKRLEKSEFVREHVSDLVASLDREADEETRGDQSAINRFVFSSIVKKVKHSKPISVKGREPKIVAIMGPTGVGKTTTLAKLAAHFWHTNNSRIAFITIDTFRIGAPVQLEKFGEILGVPTHTVFTPKELNTYIQLLTEEGKDLIFIDTFGASPSDITKIIEMKAYLSSIDGLQTLLAVSATTKYKDLLEIVASFDKVGFSEMIFTKMDETSTYGPMLSLLMETRVPLIYTTCGQEAVGNFSEANVKNLVARAIAPKKRLPRERQGGAESLEPTALAAEPVPVREVQPPAHAATRPPQKTGKPSDSAARPIEAGQEAYFTPVFPSQAPSGTPRPDRDLGALTSTPTAQSYFTPLTSFPGTEFESVSPANRGEAVSSTAAPVRESGQNGVPGHGHARIREVIFPALD